MKSREIKTARLTLRPIEDEDRAQMMKIIYCDEIKKTYMLPDLDSEEKAERLFLRLKNLSHDEEHYVRAAVLEGKLIGFLNDQWIENNAMEIGYAFLPDYWGRGYATEALAACIEDLFDGGFSRVEAGYFEENPASGRVMEKCGMKPIEKTEEVEWHGVNHHVLYRAIEKN